MTMTNFAHCILIFVSSVAALPALSSSESFEKYLDTDLPAFVNPARAHQKGVTRSMSAGIVSEVSENTIVVTHALFLNHERFSLNVHYAGVSDVRVMRFDRVERAQILGRGRPEVRYEFRGKMSKSPPFDVALLFDPREEKRLVLVSHDEYRMQVLQKSDEGFRPLHDVKNGFGQAVGKKVRQGDNKTPKGVYFVVSHHRGKFSGTYGDYYGGHWIKISYPNPFDGQRGLEKKWISQETFRSIRQAHLKRKMPIQKTKLGGGIGFHGWIGPWSDEQPHLSWGCIVMHNEDIKAAYDDIKLSTMVVVR